MGYRPQGRHTTLWEALNLPAGGAELLEAVNEGFSFNVYRLLADTIDLPRQQVAEFARIKRATLQRRAKSGKFNTEESDRLYRFARLTEAAIVLFEGDTKAAIAWMQKPAHALGSRPPAEMIGASAGFDLVMRLIGRLEHGIAA